LDPYTDVVQQIFDCAVICLLLMLFRPRALPEYFTLDVCEEDVNMYKLSPLEHAIIDGE
jgi:hypothetical protein